MKTTIAGKFKPRCAASGNFLSAHFLAALLLVLGTINGWSQGQVNFDTRAVGAICYQCVGLAQLPLSGTAWFAQLYAAAGTGASDLALAKVGNPVNFRSGVNAGYVQISGVTSKGLEVKPVVTVTTVPGGPATVQLRAWSSNFDSYEQAQAGFTGQFGKSPTLSLSATGNPQASPPTTPVDLIGLQGLQIATLVICPEPSTYVLLAGGVAALLAFRKRTSS